MTTPAGAAGLADVKLSGPGGTDTAAKGFQYATRTTIVPFATSPNFLLYDPGRNRLYASHKDQVEVIDAATNTVLTPLTPVAGKLANSQFAGLSLSPDGNRLYIADAGAQMIHMLNLASAGTGLSINVASLLGQPVAVSRIFELSTGKLLGCDGTATGSGLGTANLFTVDPSRQTGEWTRDSFGNQFKAYVWNTTSDGRYALISADLDGLLLSGIGIFDAQASTNSAPSALAQWIEEAAENGDGTALIAGGSTPGIGGSVPEVIGSDLYPLGDIEANDDVATPFGTPSFFMDATGALIYKAGTTVTTSSGGVEIYDVHTARPAAPVVLPETVKTSYTPLTDHMMTTDATGQTIFAVTQSGITIMTLNTVPLSIGNLQPAFIEPSGGKTLTVRGTGFAPGVTVKINGATVATAYVDSSTLSVQTPALPSGWLDVSVSLASGSTYTAPALLQVLPSQPVPAITGFSPSSYVVQSGNQGADTSGTVTVLGQNFEAYDTVEINGLPATTVFVDAGQLQVTIPSTLTGTTGSLSLGVVSPYAGISNTMPLPMVNPVPVIEDTPPITMTLGGSIVGLNIFGTGFVSGSIIQWYGQDLTTTLVPGETDTGLKNVSAFYEPGSDATATVTVFNPGPGGGESNPITTVEIGPSQPVLTYVLANLSTVKPVSTYYTIPSTIDFGSQVVGTTTTYQLALINQGGNYIMTAANVPSGAFAISLNECTNVELTDNTQCLMHITFSATASGQGSATLTILDNSPTSPEVITLTGKEISTPEPMVNLIAIQAAGDSSTAQFVGSEVIGGPAVPPKPG